MIISRSCSTRMMIQQTNVESEDINVVLATLYCDIQQCSNDNIQ